MAVRILPSNVDTFNRPERKREVRPVGPPSFWRTPKGVVLLVFLALIVVAAPGQGLANAVPNLLAAVVVACLVDAPFVRFETRRWQIPTGGLLTGLIVGMILAPQSSALVAAATAGLAIVGKRVIRTRREHLFNPAGLALLYAAVAAGSGESWWGALSEMSWPWLGLLLVCGAIVVDQLNKWPQVLAFTGAFFALFAGVSVFDAAAAAEMFRDPFLQSVLFLAFFMLTDPPTSPNRYVDQVWFGLVAAIAAVAAQLMGAGQIFPLVGLLVANGWLAIRRWAQRRRAAPPEAPAQAPGPRERTAQRSAPPLEPRYRAIPVGRDRQPVR